MTKSVCNNNVIALCDKSKCVENRLFNSPCIQQRKKTRGFLRAQAKRLRLLGLIPNRALIVAIDIAKAELCVWVSTTQKQPLDRFKVENSPFGMQTLIERALNIQQEHQLESLIFSMEPTGHYWMVIATYLQHHGLSYVLVQPLSVKQERQSTYYRYSKSDYRDAELIANLTADRKVTFTQLPKNSVWAGLKASASEYVLTDMMLVAEHLRLQSFLERLYPDYQLVFKDITKATALACMKLMPRLLRLSAAEYLAEAQMYYQGKRLCRHKALKFFELMTSQERAWGNPVYEDGLGNSIQQAVERYKLLLEQHRQAQTTLLEFYEKTGYAPYANSIRGVSPVLHAAALGCTGDPQDFDSSRCFTKFAGMDVKENESGSYHGQTPISHRGDPLLRYVAYLIGFTLKTHNPVFAKRYQYLLHRKNNRLKKNQAIVAVGCKYLRILWSVCTQRVQYDPHKAEYGTGQDHNEVLSHYQLN